MKKAVVVFSGGQDSTTCLYWALDAGFDVYPVSFYYGQKHAEAELRAAQHIVKMAGLEDRHEIIHLGSGILKGTSPLVNSDEKLEQYADHQSLPGGLEKTFVPMRNQLFLTIAANRAYVLGASTLVTGVCQEDNGGYPDCRDAFISSLEFTTELGTFTGVDGAPGDFQIYTPLMNLSKAASVILAQGLPGCMDALAYSHTAYDGQYPPVGHDHANLLRAKGFEEAGVPDPLVLRAVGEGLMDLPETSNYSGVAI